MYRTTQSIRLKNLIIDLRVRPEIVVTKLHRWFKVSLIKDPDDAIVDECVPVVFKNYVFFRDLPNHYQEEFQNTFDFFRSDKSKLDMVISGDFTREEVVGFLMWLEPMIVGGEIYYSDEDMAGPILVKFDTNNIDEDFGSIVLDFSTMEDNDNVFRKDV